MRRNRCIFDVKPKVRETCVANKLFQISSKRVWWHVIISGRFFFFIIISIQASRRFFYFFFIILRCRVIVFWLNFALATLFKSLTAVAKLKKLLQNADLSLGQGRIRS